MDGKTIFISGGTGSFGTAFIKHILKNYNPRKVTTYSRGEDLIRRMKKEFPDVRCRTGDIRDYDRLAECMKGADIVIHAAAMKDIDICNTDPYEAVKTNADGTANVAHACIENDTVEKAILLSTDKAVDPVNLYGATKKVGEHIWMDSNNLSFKFSICRYGNVVRSRGSVLNVWMDRRAALKEHEELCLQITHEDMTRFWLEYSDAINCVKHAMEYPSGVYVVSQTKAFILFDMLIAFDARPLIIGIRPGEKLHETLISEYEMHRALDMGDHYIIKPEFKYRDLMPVYPSGEPVTEAVTSQNAIKMSIEELKKKIGG